MIGSFIKIYAERKRQIRAIALIILGFATIAVLLVFFGGERKNLVGEKETRGNIKILRGVDLAREKWRIEGEKRLARIEIEQKEIKKEIESISDAIEILGENDKTEEYPYPPYESLREIPEVEDFSPEFSETSPDTTDASLPPSPEKKSSIRVFTPLGGGEEPDADGGTLLNWIPSGSFVPGVLLSGLDAPTGTSASRNPHPVLIHLSDTSRLANSRRMDIARCRVTGAAYGQLSSERAYVRLERLACVLRSGDIVDVEIKGYVAGEDGKTGIRGRVVSKQGKILSRGILAGFASGFGEAVETANSASGVVTGGTFTFSSRSSGDIAKTGIGGGAGEAGRLLAEYYLKLAEEVFPVIEIDAGRKVDVIVTEGAELASRKTSYSEFREEK